jgi:xylono-1,5-lactonase
MNGDHEGRETCPRPLPRVACATRAQLGEGPLWVAGENAVYWTDIKGRMLHRLMLGTDDHAEWRMPDMICWIVERQAGRGFLAGFRHSIVTLELDPLRIEPVVVPEPDLPGNRLNDAAVDSAGRLWAGTMDDGERNASGALYRLDPPGVLSRLDTGYVVSNGPAFSPDHRFLYHTDSTRRLIYRFALGADGRLGERQVFVEFPEGWGSPDGMATDVDGAIWVAHWGGGRVSRFLPNGQLDRVIELPVSQVTSCCFAGTGLDRMFVTTAAAGRDEEPEAGSLFEVFPAVRGVPCHAYAG